MPGKEARDGFWYQDAKALSQLLEDAIVRHRKRLLGEELGPELRVGVECPVAIDVDDGDGTDRGPGPTWDAVFVRDERVIVDECKLGGPTKPDRLTFYHRLRSTAERVSANRLWPRVTAGKGSIDETTWNAIAQEARTVAPAAGPLERAGTADKLAAEALYYLATPEPSWLTESNAKKGKRPPPATRALSLDDARTLMSQFTVDASDTIEQVEERLTRQLIELGAELVVDELVLLLRGWMDAAGRERPWRDDLTADSMAEKLKFFGRYVTIAPDVERLWHRLRRFVPALPPSKIEPQPWWDVQPHVELVVREITNQKRVVLTSDGGVGKSYLLANLHDDYDEPRVWIDAIAPLQDVESAIALGAWALPREHMLAVFVDAIDQAADPAGLLGAIERALGARERSHVYVAARFATWAKIRNQLHAWTPLRLERWDNSRVRAVAQVNRADPLSDDLIDLLRTPLLLDVLLRSFPRGEQVPAGLATRHGVLKEYFDRRVFFDEHAGDRRDVLDAGVEAVLRNAAMWRNSSKAAGDLVSEGVLLLMSGDLRYRHALLRDYSAALVLTNRTADYIAVALYSVTNPIVRYELLRGVIEALLDPHRPLEGPGVAEVIDACRRHELVPGIALGTTDAPTAGLMAAIAPLEGGAMLRQTLEHAKLVENRAWLRVPATLGVDRPDWFTTEHLRAMANLAELAVSTGDSASKTLATTLRRWTCGHVVGDETPWPISKIGELLARTLVDDDTLDWYESLDLRNAMPLSSFYEQLRDLAVHAHLDDERLYRAVKKVAFSAGDRAVEGHWLWEVTHQCLDDSGKARGLLSTRPAVGLHILFELSVRSEEQEQRRRRVRFERFLADVDVAEPDTQTLSEEEAIGDLVDDAPATEHSPLDELEKLKDEVEERAARDPAFAEVLAGVAIASRSVHARVMTLKLPEAAALNASITTVLRDPRVYHFRSATHPLWEVIQARWGNLDADARANVQSNILNIARSPLLSDGYVGRLATAIPPQDRRLELEPFIAEVEAAGLVPRPPRPARVEVFRGPIDHDEDCEPDGMPAELRVQWRRLDELTNVNDANAHVEAVAIAKTLAIGADSDERIWFAISRVIDRDRKREQRLLVPDDVRPIYEFAMSRAARAEVRASADLWQTAVAVADTCAAYLPDDDALALRVRVMAEVVEAAGENAERGGQALAAINFLDGQTWFDEGTGGRALFVRWFRQCLRGEALRWSLRLLPCFEGSERLDLLRDVLETPDRVDPDDIHSFVDDATHHVAAWSIWWEPDLARELVARWCEANERSGALADDVAWRTFLDRFAWCLQNAIRRARSNADAAPAVRRFVPLMTVLWSAWLRLAEESEGNFSVGWAIAAPLTEDFAQNVTPPDGYWSVSLRRLLLGAITDGRRGDIGALVAVEWGSIDRETLSLAARAAVARARRELAARSDDALVQSMIEILGGIGRVALLPQDDGNAVLDCLQHVGQTATRANQVASEVARALVNSDVRD